MAQTNMRLRMIGNINAMKSSEKRQQSKLWADAWSNMPIDPEGRTVRNSTKKARLLVRLLGYRNGHAHDRIKLAINRGSKPRDPEMQRKLQLLGGPHGTTLAKTMMIQQGITFKDFPTVKKVYDFD